MNANAKKWVNRGGILAVILGVVAVVISGGDANSALDIGGKAAVIAGAILGVIREVAG